MFECNYVRKPNDFIRYRTKIYVRKPNNFCSNVRILDISTKLDRFTIKGVIIFFKYIKWSRLACLKSESRTTEIQTMISLNDRSFGFRHSNVVQQAVPDHKN